MRPLPWHAVTRLRSWLRLVPTAGYGRCLGDGGMIVASLAAVFLHLAAAVAPRGMLRGLPVKLRR